MTWTDQMWLEGCFAYANETYRSHYPSAYVGVGVLFCPNYTEKKDNEKEYRGYGLAWCAGSNFPGKDFNGVPQYVRTYQLNNNHIMAVDGESIMGVRNNCHTIPAHVELSSYSGSPLYYYSKVKERHPRNATGVSTVNAQVKMGYGANYLFVDNHVEWSSDYGWAPSALGFNGNWGAFSGTNYTLNGSLTAYGKSESLKSNPIWVHPY